MTRVITALSGLTLLLSASVSQGEWCMRVYEGETVTEFRSSRVDSLTFYDDGFALIPAGVFVMGDGATYGCGQDEHEVTLTRDFYLAQHEVTNQEYLDAVQWAYDQGYVTATTESVLDSQDGSTAVLLDMFSYYSEIQFSEGVFSIHDSGHGLNPDHPVKGATWCGAARYCDWLSAMADLPRAYEHGGDWSCNGGDPYGAEGYRLATDAEWEYAAQFDDERLYPWGDEAPDCDRANYSRAANPCVGWTSPVGSYPDAPGALGLSDMAGNVTEWCNDWFVCDLGTDAVTDPVGPVSGSERLLRGGAWSRSRYDLRCAERDHDSGPESHGEGAGFRIARTVQP